MCYSWNARNWLPLTTWNDISLSKHQSIRHNYSTWNVVWGKQRWKQRLQTSQEKNKSQKKLEMHCSVDFTEWMFLLVLWTARHMVALVPGRLDLGKSVSGDLCLCPHSVAICIICLFECGCHATRPPSGVNQWWCQWDHWIALSEELVVDGRVDVGAQVAHDLHEELRDEVIEVLPCGPQCSDAPVHCIGLYDVQLASPPGNSVDVVAKLVNDAGTVYLCDRLTDDCALLQVFIVPHCSRSHQLHRLNLHLVHEGAQVGHVQPWDRVA